MILNEPRGQSALGFDVVVLFVSQIMRRGEKLSFLNQGAIDFYENEVPKITNKSVIKIQDNFALKKVD